MKRLNLLPKVLSAEIFIGGSKSESNRLLILNALYGGTLKLHNLSDSEDTDLLQKALKNPNEWIDIHHAGTAMRFLTAFYSIQEGRKTILTGSERMKQRPIGILVEALRSMGAKIEYLEKEGFPPLEIQGIKLEKDFVELQADTSSQYISALMLIAPKLSNGLKIQLKGKVTSLPYLMMTVEMMRKLGIEIKQEGNTFQILPLKELRPQEFVVESDWSSASYYYSLAGLSNPINLKINSFYENSIQGDAELVSIYRDYFGVISEFKGTQIQLKKNPAFELKDFELDLNNTPDIAQTIIVTATGLKLKCKLTGLETLKIKETDRILALKNELEKIGVITNITNSSIEIIEFKDFEGIPLIQTYNDHRMAMSFAPLSVLFPLDIENPEVVEKSYPNFWKDLELLH
jgi:3-phosphoshikimate 1-carboxyvinyltransferase